MSFRAMRRIVSTVILAVLLAAAVCAQAPPSQAEKQVFQEIEAIIASLSEITGLKPNKPVKHDLIGRDQVKRFIEDRIKEEDKPEEIRAE